MKQYDRAYFDRWYRDPRVRVATNDRRRAQGASRGLGRGGAAAAARAIGARHRLRRGHVARAAQEDAAGDPLRRRRLERLRARAIRQAPRDRRGTFGALGAIEQSLRGPFDAIVCCDVLQYVPATELDAGLRRWRGCSAAWRISRRTRAGMRSRGTDGRGTSGRRRSIGGRFARAGLGSVGMHCWVGDRATRIDCGVGARGVRGEGRGWMRDCGRSGEMGDSTRLRSHHSRRQWRAPP